jgi:CDP-diglyceride synthetase
MVSITILYCIIILWDHCCICGPTLTKMLCGAWLYTNVHETANYTCSLTIGMLCCRCYTVWAFYYLAETYRNTAAISLWHLQAVCLVLTSIIGLIHYSLESNYRPALWCQKVYGESCCSSGYCMQFELPLDRASEWFMVKRFPPHLHGSCIPLNYQEWSHNMQFFLLLFSFAAFSI